MLLGFSTGAIFCKVPSISRQIIAICRKIGCNIIELNTNKAKEVELFKDFINSGESLSDFQFASLHSPAIKTVYRNDKETLELLKKLEEAYHHFHCKNLVVHPPLIEDWSVFDNFSFNLAVENMSRENGFYLPEQLQKIFARSKKYKMTLDVKHAFESSLERKDLPNELFDNFQEKIAEIHLSGFNPLAVKHEHRPLVETGQVEIIEFVKGKQNIPIILEGDCADEEQMKAEYDFVKKILTV